MATEVNSIHQAGFGIDSTTGAPITGQPFFTGATAAAIEVDASIVGDVNRIAAAATAATVPGDNTNAIAMANLQGRLTMNGSSTTFDSYYSALASGVGNDVSNASANHEYEAAMVSHLENYRESVSGVSLDEEMVNLVKFQHAYEAAAKLITTVDDMLNTVLGMI
jgi:flagellar hook-associated protein 1